MVRALALILVVALAAPVRADDLKTIFADYWADELRENPFEATQSGVHDYDAQVPDASPQAQARRLESAKAFLKRLDAVDASRASDTERLSADLLRFILGHRIALAPYDDDRVPFLSDGGFHNSMGYV